MPPGAWRAPLPCPTLPPHAASSPLAFTPRMRQGHPPIPLLHSLPVRALHHAMAKVRGLTLLRAPRGPWRCVVEGEGGRLLRCHPVLLLEGGLLGRGGRACAGEGISGVGCGGQAREGCACNLVWGLTWRCGRQGRWVRPRQGWAEAARCGRQGRWMRPRQGWAEAARCGRQGRWVRPRQGWAGAARDETHTLPNRHHSPKRQRY